MGGVLAPAVRLRSNLSEERKEWIASGPGLDEFVTGSAPPTPDHLKRKKGQRLLHIIWCTHNIHVQHNMVLFKVLVGGEGEGVQSPPPPPPPL